MKSFTRVGQGMVVAGAMCVLVLVAWLALVRWTPSSSTTPAGTPPVTTEADPVPDPAAGVGPNAAIPVDEGYIIPPPDQATGSVGSRSVDAAAGEWHLPNGKVVLRERIDATTTRITIIDPRHPRVHHASSTPADRPAKFRQPAAIAVLTPPEDPLQDPHRTWSVAERPAAGPVRVRSVSGAAVRRMMNDLPTTDAVAPEETTP